MKFGEKFVSEWEIDATRPGLEINAANEEIQDTLYSPRGLPWIANDELHWSASENANDIQVKLDSVVGDTLLGAPERTSRTITLALEKSFPEAKVEISDITMSYTRTHEVFPFEVGKAEVTPELLKGILDFWSSLSKDTKEAITNNELPGGKPVILDGYASTTGKIPENFGLAHRRAEAVMTVLMMLSGNRADKELFKTKSHGEFESPEATDIRKEESERGEYRGVVITVLDVSKFNSATL